MAKFVKTYPRALIKINPYDTDKFNVLILSHPSRCVCCEGVAATGPYSNRLYDYAEAAVLRERAWGDL